jgi:hypothetical protein
VGVIQRLRRDGIQATWPPSYPAGGASNFPPQQKRLLLGFWRGTSLTRVQVQAWGTFLAPSRPLAGIWKTLLRDRIRGFVKVKSHPSLETATTAGQGHLWLGNFRAGELAERVALRVSPPRAAVDRCHQELARAVRATTSIAVLLQEWPEPPVNLTKLERARQHVGRSRISRAPHRYHFDSSVGRFVCKQCWRSKDVGHHASDSAPCKLVGIPGVSRVHSSHRLWAAPVTCGARALLFCKGCGHYSALRMSDLSRPCSPD